MDKLPNEMWLRILGLVDDSKSLGSVVLVCRKLDILGSEALVRHINWRSSTAAINHLAFWERNPSKAHLVRSLSLTLVNTQEFYDSDGEPACFSKRLGMLTPWRQRNTSESLGASSRSSNSGT
jgi:hypothetical protein